MQLRVRYVANVWRNRLTAVALCSSAFSAQAFSINLTFSGGLTADQQAYFVAAKGFWESVITGYQAAGPIAGVAISASSVPIDGIDGVLGQAGPSSDSSQGSFTFATTGVMQFDTADVSAMVSGGYFGEVIKHEMAHVLGFGTLWEANGVYNSSSGLYTGGRALAAYQIEFNRPAASYVPVEKGGGPGTAFSHWNEVDLGWSPTGVVDSQGRDFQYELMTGWLNTPTFVSQTTVASFEDIGYTVNISAVPEVGSAALLALGLSFLAATAHRRGRNALSSPALQAAWRATE